jgi:hypothetical protein
MGQTLEQMKKAEESLKDVKDKQNAPDGPLNSSYNLQVQARSMMQSVKSKSGELQKDIQKLQEAMHPLLERDLERAFFAYRCGLACFGCCVVGNVLESVPKVEKER